MYYKDGKERSYTEELTDIMNGILSCPDDCLKDHAKYLKQRINETNKCLSEMFGIKELEEIYNNMKQENDFRIKFITWVEQNRNIVA
jgi:flagellar motor switch protein FliG